MSFQVSDRSDVNVTLSGIGRERLRLQVHQLDLAHSVFIDDDLTLEVVCQIEEDLLLSERVGEQEDAMVLVALNDGDQSLICFLSRREVILWVGEGVVHVEVVAIDCDAFELWIALLLRAEPFIVKHCLRESEITCVEDCAHLSFEQEHHCSRTVKGVHEHDLHAILLVLVQVDPVLLVHLQVNDEARKPGKSVRNELFRQI